MDRIARFSKNMGFGNRTIRYVMAHLHYNCAAANNCRYWTSYSIFTCSWCVNSKKII